MPRLFAPLILFATLCLSACDAPAPSAQAAGPAAVVARSVTVDTSGFAGIEGRDFVRSPATVGADLTRALERDLSRSGVAGTADVTFELSSVRLTSPVGAATFAGASRISGVLTVRDSETGAVIFGPEAVEGTSETLRIPGAIGVVTSPTAEADYQQTVDGFAADINDLLNGSESGA